MEFEEKDFCISLTYKKLLSLSDGPQFNFLCVNSSGTKTGFS